MKIEKTAAKALKKMPVKTANKFMAAFKTIEYGKTGKLDIAPLSGRDGCFRLRIGAYRAIYTVSMEVIVIRVGPRGDVYK